MNRLLIISSFALLFVTIGEVLADTNSKECTADDININSETCASDNVQESTNDTGTGTKEDRDAHCKAWASRGECQSNPSYMTENCAMSCSVIDETEIKGLVNTNENCPQYAKLGECDVNPRFMREVCAKSCHEYDRLMQRTPIMRQIFNEGHKRVINNNSGQCQLYMAESAIPNAGLGMYSAVQINRGELVSHPEIIVSYFDYVQHAEKTYMKNMESSDEVKKVIGNKIDNHKMCSEWAQEGECENNPKYMLESCKRACAIYESELMNGFNADVNWVPNDYHWDATNTDSIFEAVTTDSLVPGVGALANSHTGLVNVGMSRPSIDNAGMHRSFDPSVGSFSTHYNTNWIASKPIPAGMEIFAAYGDSWFEGREHKFGPLPLSFDFINADNLLKKFWKVVDENDPFAQDLLTLTKDLQLRANLRMAIPDKLEDAKKARQSGTAMMSVPDVIRSEEWLQENGICIDNMKQDQSSIIHAGRGAFATRSISKGDVIAPLPLIHMSKEKLRMYKESEDEKETIEYEEYQLLLNYCYGHEKSSLVMFPYSPVTNFINHNFNHSAINVKLQWSRNKNNKSNWLDKSSEEVIAEPYTGLIFEFVALRNIDEGEELFIDYGKEWEAAWTKHVDEWEATTELKTFPVLYHLNLQKEVLTVTEQRKKPYSSNVMTICFVRETVMHSDSKPISWTKYSVRPHDANHVQAYQCEITSRTKEGLYKVLLYEEDENSRKKVSVEDVPRHAIEFVYRMYRSDQHIKNAFRHSIAIPDEIFPSKWMDLD